MLSRAKQTAANSVIILSNGSAPSLFQTFTNYRKPLVHLCHILHISSRCRYSCQPVYIGLTERPHCSIAGSASNYSELPVCSVSALFIWLYITTIITVCQQQINIYIDFSYKKAVLCTERLLLYQNTPQSRKIAAAPVTRPSHCFFDSFSFQNISPAAVVSSMPAPFTTG